MNKYLNIQLLNTAANKSPKNELMIYEIRIFDKNVIIDYNVLCHQSIEHQLSVLKKKQKETKVVSWCWLSVVSLLFE